MLTKKNAAGRAGGKLTGRRYKERIHIRSTVQPGEKDRTVDYENRLEIPKEALTAGPQMQLEANLVDGDCSVFSDVGNSVALLPTGSGGLYCLKVQAGNPPISAKREGQLAI